MTTAAPSKPKRLTLEQLRVKHNVPEMTEEREHALLTIGKAIHYREADGGLSYQIIRIMRDRDFIVPSNKIFIGCGSVIWKLSPLGETTYKALRAMMAERQTQKAPHGLVSAA